MCEMCDSIFSQHNPDRSGPICSCGGCQTRAAAIRTNRNTVSDYNTQGRKEIVATVNFCERCNTMGKSSAMGSLEIWTGNQSDHTERFEICPGCVADFVTWRKAESIGDRPKSYSEPYSARKADPLADLSDDEIARAYLARVAAREGLNELTDGSDGTV